MHFIEKGFNSFADVLTILLNESMKVERSHTLIDVPYERYKDRKGYANSFKPKAIKNKVGELNVNIPQARGDIKFYPSTLKKGCRREKALCISIAEMYFNGVATRKVKNVFEKLCGVNVTSQEVSRLTEKLDAEFMAWRERELGAVAYVILDAKYEKARVNGVVRDAAILRAIDVRESDG